MKRRSVSLRQLSFLFLPRDAMHSADYAIAMSVRLSVTRWYSVETAKRNIKLFSPSASHSTLYFSYKTVRQCSDGDPSNGGVECKSDMNKNSAIANRSRVSCADNTLRASIGLNIYTVTLKSRLRVTQGHWQGRLSPPP